MEDLLKEVKDRWNETPDSEWYKSLRTDEKMEKPINNPISAFRPVAYALITKYIQEFVINYGRHLLSWSGKCNDRDKVI